MTTRISEWSNSANHNKSQPLLVSEGCYDSLVTFFRNSSSELLAVTAEAQSHPSSLFSLYAQPWEWTSGGLGNIDECPLQVCLAGGTSRDSVVFGSACIVPECNAFDLAAEDFPARLEVASFEASKRELTKNVTLPDGTFRISETHDESTIKGYVTSYKRFAETNKFLKTGWVCGEYIHEWETGTSIYLFILISLILLSYLGTFVYNKRKYRHHPTQTYSIFDDEEKKDETAPREISQKSIPRQSFWMAWDMRSHLMKLCSQRPETACLDGLKLWSILWIILGHTVAIECSVGPRYLNPGKWLPPNGTASSLLGQVVFGARFAVDTFLCIGGYLVVYTLKRKLTEQTKISNILFLVAARILRILPLYGMCIGFWMFVAPHLGSGPFWYEWKFYLEPCRKYWWTNFLFVNNFLPWERPTTDSCFYHSWYLAVDLQLFLLFGPWLVMLYLRSPQMGRRVTLFLWVVSVIVTAALTYMRHWSINTLDGGPTVLFDIEGYAKPHVRAQTYLAGMLVGMLPKPKVPSRNGLAMIAAMLGLVFLSLITVTGPYSRRACLFKENPYEDDCGSSWSPAINFLYNAFARALWSVCIAIIMRLCIEQRGGIVGSILGCSIWTPLAHLSYGAYLIHPVVIFVWTLGEQEKITFSSFTTFMNFTSITVVSFIFSCLAALVIEFPCAALMRSFLLKNKKKNEEDHSVMRMSTRTESIPLTFQRPSYGAT